MADRTDQRDSARIDARTDERPGSERYRALPRIVRLEETVPVVEVIPPNDPTMGRDPERDFMLRHAGG